MADSRGRWTSGSSSTDALARERASMLAKGMALLCQDGLVERRRVRGDVWTRASEVGLELEPLGVRKPPSPRCLPAPGPRSARARAER